MNLIGIGTDIVDIRRVARLHERYGERFTQRILTQREHRDLAQAPLPAAFLAKRFAAKEAISKALGSGIRDEVYWRRIEVSHDAQGRPTAQLLSGLLPQTVLHLSISDECHYALACAVALTQ